MISGVFEKIAYKKRQRAFVQQVKANGLWFVDIPRTGSTNLKQQLGAHLGSNFSKNSKYIHNHAPGQKVKGLVGPEIWRNLKTFTIVRNPWDRAVSIYRYMLKYTGRIPDDMTFNQFVRQYVNPSYNFFSSCSPYSYFGYFWSCAEYLLDEEGKPLVDKVFRFESYQTSVAELSDWLGLPLYSDQKVMSGGGGHYSKYYDEKSVQIIADHFWKDIELFGYSFRQ